MLHTRNTTYRQRKEVPQTKCVEKISLANGTNKQAEAAILILNNINFQPKVIIKVKEGHFICVKGKTIYQD